MKRTLLVCLLLMPAMAGISDLRAQTTGAGEPPENFLWVFGQLHRDSLNYQNLLAFAKRHDLSLIFSPAALSDDMWERTKVEAALKTAKEQGLTAWINTGVFTEADGWPTADVIINDPQWRAKYKKSLKDAVSLYFQYYPGGRVIVGHEDPYFSNFPAHSWDNFFKYGADIFRIQREAVRELDPTVPIGFFSGSGRLEEAYATIMVDLASTAELPDFNFYDKYRGYRDPAVGLEANDANTLEQLDVIRRFTRGRPIYYLGQDHTINTGYTPSKAAINGHLDAGLASGVEGMGWYIRTRYVKTKDVSTVGGTVEPFLPNVGEVNEARYNSFTGDRDRFMYAYLATLERQGLIAPEEKFDLWIHGTDLDLHEARLFLRTAEGGWEFIGDVGTYVGGDNPYSLDEKTGAVIFHALDRDRFLRGAGGARGRSGGVVEAKIEAREGSDGLVIRGMYAMPYNETRDYITEQDAAALLEADRVSIRERSHAHQEWQRPRPLRAGKTLQIRMAPVVRK